MPINFKDPFAQTALKTWLTKQYGGWSQQTEDLYRDISSKSDYSSVLSDQSGLMNRLKGMSETGMEGLSNYRQSAQTQVNNQYNKSATGLREILAQSGMLRSGVGTAGQMSLEAGRMGALGDVETNLMQQNEQYKSNALAQLLGFTQNIDAQKLQEAGLDQNALLALLGYGNTTDTRAQQSEREGAFGSGLGNLLGKGLSMLPMIL